MEQTPSEQDQERLANNPYTFKPSPEKTAVFHAILSRDLVRPASQFYPDTQAYFQGKLPIEHWQALGLQGIADLAARITHDDNASDVAQRLPTLPESPLFTLCQCLEHIALPTGLTEALNAQAKQALQQGNDTRLSLLIRAMASAPAQGLRAALLDQILTSAPAHAEFTQTLIAIAGRCWQDLADQARLHAYFEAVVQQPNGIVLFQQLFADLLGIPQLRPYALALLRTPERSVALSQAIGSLFQSAGHA